MPLGLVILEAWTLVSTNVAKTLETPLKHAAMAFQEVIHIPSQSGPQLEVFFYNLCTWAGLALGAVLLAVCVWLRNFKWEIGLLVGGELS